MPTLATLLVLSAPLLSQPDSGPLPQGKSAEEIAAAARRLANDDFATREQATDELWRAGLSARPVLEAVARSDDREVALRARSVLEKFRFGIFLDTPPETLALIEAYRSGPEHEKSESLRKLHSKRQWSTLAALISGESSQELRQRFARSFERGLRHGAREQLARRDFDRAEELLAWTAEFDEYGGGLRDYAAFLLARGKLAATIDRVQRAGTYRHDKNAARVLARLLQVHGNLQEAMSIAELTDDKYLKADLYYRLEDWESLAPSTPDVGGVEKLGFTAAFYRLAGSEAGLERAIADLRALAHREPDWAWSCAKALMLNERWEDGIELVPPVHLAFAFQCRCGQMRFADAFHRVGITDPEKAAAEWFAQRARALAPASPEATGHFQLGLEMAKTLRILGEHQESARLLAELARQPDDLYSGRFFGLLQAEEGAGLEEQAKQRALNLLGKEHGIFRVMYHWYGEGQAGMASWWWKFLCHISPDEDRAMTLTRLERLMRPGRGVAAADNVAELAGRAEDWSEELKLEQRVAALNAIAEVCALHGELKLARAYLEKHAKLAHQIPVPEFDGNPPRALWPLLRIGDLFAQEKKWLQAASAYGRVWQLQTERAASLYLQGFSLDQAGRHEEGRQLMELANLLPLANTERREELAETMQKLGQPEAALEQWELILRLGAFEGWEGSEHWAVKQACRALAEHLADKDRLRAADLWEHYLHYLLKTNVGFTYASSYPEVVHLVRRQRALGLLEAGRTDEALRELAQAQAAMPGDVELVATAMPMLVRAGRTADAERIFTGAFEAYDKVCRDFPRSASHHSRLAWLAARCDKRLDDALSHAQQAVELDRDNPAFVDTLAEVHFRRGDVHRAVALERQAVEREPDNKHYQQQLRRFSERN